MDLKVEKFREKLQSDSLRSMVSSH